MLFNIHCVWQYYTKGMWKNASPVLPQVVEKDFEVQEDVERPYWPPQQDSVTKVAQHSTVFHPLLHLPSSSERLHSDTDHWFDCWQRLTSAGPGSQIVSKGLTYWLCLPVSLSCQYYGLLIWYSRHGNLTSSICMLDMSYNDFFASDHTFQALRPRAHNTELGLWE